MKKQLTIGVVCASVHESYQSLIWSGILEQGSKYDLDFTTFIGTSQNKINTLFVQFDMITDLINEKHLDGVIIFSGSMRDYCSSEYVQDFCDQIGVIPIVCISYPVPGYSSVLINNSSGIIESINHLIHSHQCNRIAFVKGPEGHDEAEERFGAYRQALDDNEIPFAADLVFPGDFLVSSGKNAVNQIVEKNIEVDAIVAVDDNTAFGVIEGLQFHKDRLHSKIAIVGFDDVSEAKIYSPSLTTVRQPLKKMGETAIDVLLEQINGKSGAQDIYLPTEFIIRQSCGCFVHFSQEDEQRDTCDWQSGGITDSERINKVAQQLVRQLADETVSKVDLLRWCQQILHGLWKDLETNSHNNYFLNALNETLPLYRREGGDLYQWQKALTTIINLKDELFSERLSIGQVDILFHKARILISEEILKSLRYKQTVDEMKNIWIRKVIQQIITTYDFDELLATLTSGVSELGIKSCYMSLFSKKKYEELELDRKLPQKSALYLAIEDNNNLLTNNEPIFYETVQFLPEEVKKRRTNREPLIYMPLFFEEDHFGYIIFSHMSNQAHFLYEQLRIHISSAIKSSFILKELKTMSLKDELTGLYNRRGFITLGEQQCIQARRNNRNLTLFYADMDNLKTINDTYGHHEGDFAIKKTAELIEKTFREQDILARLGGDEFTVLALETQPDTDVIITKRLQQQFDQFNQSSSKPYDLSLSVGATHYNSESNLSFPELMNVADEIMMEKKRKKKGTRSGVQEK